MSLLPRNPRTRLDKRSVGAFGPSAMDVSYGTFGAAKGRNAGVTLINPMASPEVAYVRSRGVLLKRMAPALVAETMHTGKGDADARYARECGHAIHMSVACPLPELQIERQRVSFIRDSYPSYRY